VEAGRGRRRADRDLARDAAALAGQCYTIGTVAGVLQPIAARKGLRNLPEKGVFNWEPQAQFGVYLPDTFWYGP
jgi:peptide/nickel transport system substrate-binding protein